MAEHTRSLRGARRRFAWVVAAVIAVGARPAHAAHPDEGVGPLPWRVGGRVGFTVDAAAFPDSQGHALEVYVRIPPSTLAELTLDSTAVGKVTVDARLKSGYGAKPEEHTETFQVAAADSAQGFGRVVLLRFPLHTGPQKLMVRVEDSRSKKRGLIYMVRTATESGQIDGTFQVTLPKSGTDVSDVEFVWPRAGPGAGAAFQRSGHDVVPNPERLYGLHANDLHAYFKGRGDAADTRPWQWHARILDRWGKLVAEHDSSAAAAPWLDAEIEFDLTHEPAGGYQLEVSAGHQGEPPVMRQAKFSIAWQTTSWFRNPRDVEDAVHLLLQPDDEDTFALMHPGEQERMLDDFWRVRDPSPGTAANEAYDTFHARAVAANRNYSRIGSGPGMLTDMGRTFVRYGEPSEVLKQVIPAGDNTLSQVLSDIAADEDRAVGDVHQKGPGGDMRPFEVWIYEGDIAPPVDADPRDRRAHRKRLLFLFVDEQGLGQYTLRYSTE